MKKQLLLLLLLLSVGIFAQQTPEFSFEFYIEDALGNKDTVIIGYDDQATNGIDADFGEIDILNQPWNSNLEARIGDKTYSGLSSPLAWIQPNSYLSKKQIVKSYCQEIDYPERVSIQFTTNNYPITIKWNDKLFEENCHKYSFIFGQDDHYHFDATGLLMLRIVDSIVIDSSLSLEFAGNKLASYEMNGNTIGVLQFVFHRYSTLDIYNNEIEEPKVFPNPIANNFINVIFDGHYVLQDMTGKIIQKGKVDDNKIGFDSLKKGIYNLLLINGNTTHQFKILK